MQSGNPTNLAAQTNAVTSESPLVTIVIPVYNRLQYVGTAIESVLAQTYTNIEIIVVDDGSKIDVADVLAPYSDRIQLYRKPNGGMASARNFGIEHAQGTYVLFLDDDDTIDPHAVETLLSALRSQPGAMWAVARFAYMDEAGQPLPRQPRCHYESGDIYEGMIYENLLGTIHAILLNTAAVRAAGAFDESLRLSEDYDLWLRLARDYPVVAVQEKVANYRMHGQQISTTRWINHFECHFRVLSKNLALAKPGYEATFARSKAQLHLAFGDEWYVNGDAAQARRQWIGALKASSSVAKPGLLFRLAKSYIPRPALSLLRDVAGRWRSRGNSRQSDLTPAKN